MVSPVSANSGAPALSSVVISRQDRILALYHNAPGSKKYVPNQILDKQTLGY